MKNSALFSLFALLATQSFAQLPGGIVDTQAPGETPPPPLESLEKITVPEGFHISLFAGEPDVAQPIAIEYDDKGRLWVLESFSYIEWKRTGKDRLLIFEDTDNDGQFDKRKVFWDQGNHTSGFQIGHGGVWLCDAPELLFIPDADRDDIPDAAPTAVLDGWSTKAEHNFFNGLKWGPDGWLYGRHGIKAPSNVGKPGAPDDERTPLSCSIWRYHPVKKAFEVWAEGTVNPWGLDWNEEGEGFIHTSVIDHFWHLVPGARYPRGSWKSPDSSSYALMKPTSDHRHWSGGETGRKDFGGNDEAGGGHSHSGLVIYQADSWPGQYRGKAFFGNVLGQRINMDHLSRKASAWNASHGDDFLKSSSPWFRIVDLCQGPYGEMMTAEWTDLGECHDRDGIHRSSGRLYEVWHGERAGKEPFDVASMSTKSLVDLLFHENVWWRRHALRNLHERVALAPESQLVISEDLQQLLIGKARTASIPDAISAIQGLHAVLPGGEWIRSVYDSTLASGDAEARAPVRVHLLTLTFTESIPTPDQVQWLEEMIAVESDPAVLYRMSALLQRIPIEHRWNAAEALSRITIDNKDRNFSLMRWYGFEPLVESNPVRAMKVAVTPGHAWLSESITRRAIEADALPDVITALLSDPVEEQPLQSILAGLLESLPVRSETPQRWSDLFSLLKGRKNPAILTQAFQLALRFGDPQGEKEIAERILAESTTASDRLKYFRMLVSAESPAIANRLPELIQFPELTLDAIRAETVFAGDDSALRLLSLLSDSENEKNTAILETLASRENFADALVEAVFSGEVAKERIPAYVARQVLMTTSRRKAFSEFLGINEKDASQKAAQIATWKKRLSKNYLALGNAEDGREVFRRTCAACHQLYGEGGVIGPDLTGSGRADLDYFLINTLFPSEDVSPDYRLVTLTLKDGRTLLGNVVEESGKVLTFRQVGQVDRIDTSEIKSREVSGVSLMPPGLLDSMRKEDVRDLFLYLQTTKPLSK
ncbi:PVC-type heme-binding CxxCH protein [Verrucomicrobiales bacterium BCK34]|nr:PVC-type heme-binding CxxCH protein [Verrucomicrobiales bacterium BCK34]